MQITKKDFYAAIKAGLEPKKKKLSAFALACFDMNSADELLYARANPHGVDRVDCASWSITPEEWAAGIDDALQVAMYVFECDHGLDRVN